MTPDDAPLAPVAPVGADPVEPAMPSPVTTTGRDLTAPAAAGTSRPQGLDPDAPIGAATVRSELEQAPLQPSVVARALVHDAAIHGGRLAGAIEDAAAGAPPTPGAVSDVSDRAQVLGGAAASAASGQATPRPVVTDMPEEPRRSDLIVPVPAIDEDPHRDDPRPREQQHSGERHPRT
ncbi:MAG: hypothetical protein JWM86_162 [Thermoleophilia bacterium]|nr:hypothetical protein [Thermoleophilia bacterium]